MARKTQGKDRHSKKQILADADRKARAAIHQRLRELRQERRDLRTQRAFQLAKAREHCRTSRLRARGRAKTIRSEHLQAATREIEKLITENKTACSAKVQAIKKRKGSEIAKRAAEARELKGYERTVYVLHARRDRARAKAEKKRHVETDAQVLANLDEELRPLWKEMAAEFRGRARMSRTEQFLQWVHDHPEEIAERLDWTPSGHNEALASLDKQTEKLYALLALPAKARITDRQLAQAGIDPAECRRIVGSCDSSSEVATFTESPEFAEAYQRRVG